MHSLFSQFFFVRGYFDQLDFAGDILFFKLERRQSHQCQKQTLGGGRRSKTNAAISHASIRIIAFIVMHVHVRMTHYLSNIEGSTMYEEKGQENDL